MPIQNVIFDMGQVLIDYCPERYTAAFLPGGENTEDCKLVTQVLFGGKVWQQLDAGQITETDAIQTMLPQLPQRLRKPARALFYGWQSYIRPIPETNQLAQDLHRAGYGIYILSNTGVRLHVYSHRIPAFQVMDGAVYSADVQQIKPDPAIYKTLFSHYSLQPQTCFFIDDNAENIATANALGLQTHCYTRDFSALTADLHRAGVTW
ncbi:MAG: HAD family phosphatase [Oscillospiraceae bacterium]|nr:HAD family phosphatase [Oscillospiraceae bacterium]